MTQAIRDTSATAKATERDIARKAKRDKVPKADYISARTKAYAAFGSQHSFGLEWVSEQIAMINEVANEVWAKHPSRTRSKRSPLKEYHVSGIIQMTIRASTAEEAVRRAVASQDALMKRHKMYNISVDNIDSANHAGAVALEDAALLDKA